MPSASMATRDIVAARADGSVHRTNWCEVAETSRRLAQALVRMGVQPGERVATLAMNHDRHLVAWFGVVGMGGVLHTLNPRLFDDQLTYIVNHAEDRVIFYDKAFAPMIERMKADWPAVRPLRLLRRRIRRAAGRGKTAITLVRGRRARSVRPLLHQRDDRQPQGRAVRASFDRAPRHVGRRARHLRPFGALGDPAGGADVPRQQLVHSLCGGDGRLQARHLRRQSARAHRASCSTRKASPIRRACRPCGSSIIDHVEETGASLGKLHTIIVGGSSAPPATIRWFRKRGIRVNHLWGMTEMSPVGTVGAPPANWDSMSDEEQVAYLSRPGPVDVRGRAASCRR